MTVVEQLNADLKQALLSGDKELVSVLRGLKSAILYEEVARGKRDEGLDDAEVLKLLQKELKKRNEAVKLYEQGGNDEKAGQEKYEAKIISGYLPEMLSDDEITLHVEAAIKETGAKEAKDMGKVIGLVKAKTEGRADGAAVARITKEKLG